MRTASVNFLNPAFLQRVCAQDDGSGRVDNVIDENCGFAFNVPDDIHDLADVGLGTAFVDNRQRSVEEIRKFTGANDTAMVRRHNDRVLNMLRAEILSQDRYAQHMIHRNIEETLDLHRMQVHRNNTMRSGFLDQIRNQLGCNRIAGAGLPVLTGITVVRNDHVDALGRSPFQSIYHHQKLHQIIVDRSASGLYHINVAAANAFGQLDLNFAVTEARRLRVSHRNSDVIGNLVSQLGIGVTGEDLQFRITISHKFYYPPCCVDRSTIRH
ncbi:hypothetical protein D1872_219400 [compost metagenome]